MCCNKNWSLISIISYIYIYIHKNFLMVIKQTILETPPNLLKTLKIFGGAFRFSWGIISFEDPQTLWGSSEFSEEPHSQNFLKILRNFWGPLSSEFSEDRYPQNFLRIVIVILRIFWGSSSSEFSEDRYPQNFLRILRIFWGSSSSSSSEFSEDPILRMTILRKFSGWGSSENSEDEDPQKVLGMTILRKFWWSLEDSEDSLHFFLDNHQKIWLMTIPVIIWYIRRSSARRSLQKKQKQSQARSTALLCTQTTRSVLLVLLFFPDHQSYIYFKIDQNMMIIIKCIWYSITRYIQRLSEWWTLANLILKGKQTQSMPLFCIHTCIQHALFDLLCLPLFPCSKITWCMSRKWYPDKLLMISFKRSDYHL